MLLDTADGGKGGLVFIAGEAGVGKTRLAVEFARQAKARGSSTLHAKSVSGNSNVLPYSAWVECVRQFASEATVLSFIETCGDLSEPMLRLLPEMAILVRRQGAREKVARDKKSALVLSGESPVKYFNAVSEFLFRLSRRATLMLVLDDFQWCDRSSVDLLQYITTHGLENHALLIICLYRDTNLKEINQPLHQLTTGSHDSLGHENVIQLKRLDIQTATRLLKGSSIAPKLSDPFCKLLYHKTGGNPLFMKETLALLAQRGILSSVGTYRGVASRIPDIQIPDSVKDVTRSRLAVVSLEVQEVLQQVALAGETFDFRLLKRLVPSKDNQALRDILDAASSSGLVQPVTGIDEGRSFNFVDEVVIEVLTEGFSDKRLREHHLRIAKIKEEEYAEKRDDRAAELAEHFRRGGNHDKALEYSIKAGDAAAKVQAHREARIHYERALDSLGQLRDEGRELTRGEVLEKLGNHLWFEGEAHKACADWEDAARTYEAMGKIEKAALVRRMMGWQYSMLCEADKANEEYSQALHLFSRPRSGPGLATLYYHLGQHYQFENKSNLARESFLKAIEIAREFRLLDVEVLSRLLLAWVTPIDKKEEIVNSIRKCDLITPEHITSQSYDLAFGSDFTLTHILWIPGISIAKFTGDTMTSKRHLSQALEVAKKIGNERLEVWDSAWLAEWGLIPGGEWEKAKHLLEEASSWPHLETFPAAKANIFDVLGEIALLEGDLDNAESLLKVASDYSSRLGLYTWWDTWCFGYRIRLSRLHALKGDYRQAESYLRELYKLQKRRDPPLLFNADRFVECLFSMVYLYVEVGNRQEAASYLAELQEFARFANTDWARAYSWWATGIVFSLNENWDSAIPALEEAIKCWRSLNWPYQLAGTCHFAGLARMERGEVELAGGLFDEALAIFNGLGAKLDAQRTLAAKEALKDQGSSRVFSLSREGSERSKKIFEYLVVAFIGDYFTRRLPPDSSGWRSLARVARDTKIPRYGFYVTTGKNPKGGVRELLRLGLVDEKEFPHQRGRGGTATCIRIAYENDDAKKYIARRTRSRERETPRDNG